MKRSRSLILSLVTVLTATLGAAWVALPAYAAGPTATFVKVSDWAPGGRQSTRSPMGAAAPSTAGVSASTRPPA